MLSLSGRAFKIRTRNGQFVGSCFPEVQSLCLSFLNSRLTYSIVRSIRYLFSLNSLHHRSKGTVDLIPGHRQGLCISQNLHHRRQRGRHRATLRQRTSRAMARHMLLQLGGHMGHHISSSSTKHPHSSRARACWISLSTFLAASVVAEPRIRNKLDGVS